MTSNEQTYLDGNAAAGPFSEIFAVDVTQALGRCAFCGAEKHFAQARLFNHAPGMVMRCSTCENVLARMVNCGDRIYLDMRGIAALCFVTGSVTS